MIEAPGDHFSDLAEAYARHRPRYPPALYDWLGEQSPGRRAAWDCATGNGQAALELARRFERVEATDVSPTQLARAPAHPRIAYREAPGEASGIAAGSVDLVTVAQAAHWLDLPRFFAEVERVARPGAVLAIWGYLMLRTGVEDLDAAIGQFFSATVGAYWPPGRELLDAGYRDFEFPFPEIAAPRFTMAATWSLAGLQGYLSSWSAVDRYRKALGIDPVPPFVVEIAPLWGEPTESKTVSWPLALRVARLSS